MIFLGGINLGYISDIRKKVGHDAIFMPVAACGIIKDDKILLQKRTDNGKWAIHGGSLELGETFLEALERELKEELNIMPINPEMVNVYSGNDLHFVYPNNDEVFIISTVYLVKEYEGELKPDYDEVSQIRWFGFDKLPDNIHEPDIKPINDIIFYYENN